MSNAKELAEATARLAEEIERMEATLKARRAQYEYLTTSALPEAMDAEGLETVVLDDLTKFHIEPRVHVNYTKGGTPEVHDWLRDVGSGEIIRPTVTITFAKGKELWAGAARKLLMSHFGGVVESVETKLYAHPRSVATLIKARYKSGRHDIPDAVGVFTPRVAVLTPGISLTVAEPADPAPMLTAAEELRRAVVAPASSPQSSSVKTVLGSTQPQSVGDAYGADAYSFHKGRD